MKTSRRIKKLIKKAIFYPYSEAIRQYQQCQRRKIVQILSRTDKPIDYDSDRLFEILQNKYQSPPEQGFDFYSSWERGIQRTSDLLKKFELLRKPGVKILEACCGDGMTGYALQTFGHDVILTDIDDWRHDKAKGIAFIKNNLSLGLPLDSNSFDFICSFDAFEHIDNPQVAFDKLLRVCKKEGYIYLEFGPLYASPLGLHAFQTLRMPYPQYLFSEDFINDKLNKLGIFDLGKKLSELQPLNKWRVKDFINLYSDSKCEVISFSKFIIDSSHLDIILKYPNAFTGRGLDFEDVTVQALAICVKKK